MLVVCNYFSSLPFLFFLHVQVYHFSKRQLKRASQPEGFKDNRKRYWMASIVSGVLLFSFLSQHSTLSYFSRRHILKERLSQVINTIENGAGWQAVLVGCYYISLLSSFSTFNFTIFFKKAAVLKRCYRGAIIFPSLSSSFFTFNFFQGGD